MISEKDRFALEVQAELARVRIEHQPLHSFHEGLAVILEELEEFKAEVFKKSAKRDHANMYRELVQIAAMAQRTAEDCL